MAMISFYSNFRDTIGTKTTVQETLSAIRSGQWARAITDVRAGVGNKSDLAAVTFSGYFAPNRAKANLRQHSGVIVIDLDKLANVQITKEHLIEHDEYAAFAFISPSGNGLKIGYNIANI